MPPLSEYERSLALEQEVDVDASAAGGDRPPIGAWCDAVLAVELNGGKLTLVVRVTWFSEDGDEGVVLDFIPLRAPNEQSLGTGWRVGQLAAAVGISGKHPVKWLVDELVMRSSNGQLPAVGVKFREETYAGETYARVERYRHRRQVERFDKP